MNVPSNTKLIQLPHTIVRRVKDVRSGNNHNLS